MSARIGVTGSAGVGKSRLAGDLAAAAGLPAIAEEMRARILRDGRDLASRSADERCALLGELWRERRERERGLRAFVADNCALDFSAYALFHGCLDDDRPDPELLREPPLSMAAYDAVFVLPWGGIEYQRDGVRGASQSAQLRYQLLIEALLARHLAPERVHHVPLPCRSPEQRLEFALGVLRRRALLPQPGPTHSSECRAGPVASGGRVHLVGAGPGHPELLTVRAHNLLAHAQVVAFDRLVPPSLLSLAPHTAEWIDVGHRGHGSHEAAPALHPEVLRRARAGQDVVRLKIGDPLVFGRGGEEARELARAGVAFEIVPGISAALAAGAAAGIPLTQRGVSASVTLATGHAGAPDPRGEDGTLVLYMASRNLPRVVAGLLAQGRAASTPAAFVAAAACPEQRVVVSTLGALAEDVQELDRSLPGLVIVGEVVRLREELDWRARVSLAGRRILIGRARPGASRLAARLRELGADVLEAPQVSTEALAELGGLDEALDRIASYNGVLFACAEGVRYTLERLLTRGRDVRDLAGVPLIALGEGAARTLAERGLGALQASRGVCRESLAQDLRLRRSGRYLGIGGAIGRRSLRRDLESLGARVHWVGAYSHQYHFPRFELGRVDLVVYPSSSVARLLLSGPLAGTCRGTTGLAIGERSESAARQGGVRYVACSLRDDVDELISAVLRLLAAAPPSSVLPLEART